MAMRNPYEPDSRSGNQQLILRAPNPAKRAEQLRFGIREQAGGGEEEEEEEEEEAHSLPLEKCPPRRVEAPPFLSPRMYRQ